MQIFRIRLFGTTASLRDGGRDVWAAEADNAATTDSSASMTSEPVASGGSTTCATRHRLDDEIAERSQVADDGEVPEVPQQHARGCCPLLRNWFMPVLPAPFRDALESPPKAVRSSLLLHHPKSLAGDGPVMTLVRPW
jgi:hypothetical protein